MSFHHRIKMVSLLLVTAVAAFWCHTDDGIFLDKVHHPQTIGRPIKQPR